MRRIIIIAALASLLGACAAERPEMETVDYVDLDRFMGDWYVIANIPTFIEKGAHNAVETYAMNPDGTIDTTFSFRAGSFDGKQKEYNPRGFIRDTETNALWGMRFIWPIKADYRIIYLNDDYTQTIIGRQKRDFVWIMARESEIPEEDYQEMLRYIESIGYDINDVQRVPQQW